MYLNGEYFFFPAWTPTVWNSFCISVKKNLYRVYRKYLQCTTRNFITKQIFLQTQTQIQQGAMGKDKSKILICYIPFCKSLLNFPIYTLALIVWHICSFVNVMRTYTAYHILFTLHNFVSLSYASFLLNFWLGTKFLKFQELFWYWKNVGLILLCMDHF